MKYVNKENDLKASIGGRMFADVAYYHTEWTPMKSGAAITDARIHASLTYGKLFIYADFGFGNGEFSQKNLFAQYTFKESLKGIHLVKAGYYNEPSSMSMMTSSYNYHFISRPSVSQALDPGRSLGATYKFFNRHFFADQGIFSQLKYNEQEEGYQGFSLSGRWLGNPSTITTSPYNSVQDYVTKELTVERFTKMAFIKRTCTWQPTCKLTWMKLLNF